MNMNPVQHGKGRQLTLDIGSGPNVGFSWISLTPDLITIGADGFMKVATDPGTKKHGFVEARKANGVVLGTFEFTIYPSGIDISALIDANGQDKHPIHGVGPLVSTAPTLTWVTDTVPVNAKNGTFTWTNADITALAGHSDANTELVLVVMTAGSGGVPIPATKRVVDKVAAGSYHANLNAGTFTFALMKHSLDTDTYGEEQARVTFTL